LAVWWEDEAGPFQAVPQAGRRWPIEGHPATQAQEWIRGGTTKGMTLFEPSTGVLDLPPPARGTHPVLPAWLKEELEKKLARLPAAAPIPAADANRAPWAVWQEGLPIRFTLPAERPAFRARLGGDNWTGHKTPEMGGWFWAHGLLPWYTPLGGSWWNRAESIQRLRKRRALARQHPDSGEPIGRWREAVATHGTQHPPPLLWGGKRQQRRRRGRERPLHR
jgi:hypothetical protein